MLSRWVYTICVYLLLLGLLGRVVSLWHDVVCEAALAEARARDVGEQLRGALELLRLGAVVAVVLARELHVLPPFAITCETRGVADYDQLSFGPGQCYVVALES